MTEFLFGLFTGAISMFFAVGWMWKRVTDQMEPTDSSRVDFEPHPRNGRQ